MSQEFHALGLAYRSGRNRGFVVVRFTVSGNRIIAQDLVSPEPEAIVFAAARLKAECGRLLQEAREDVEHAATKADR
jgi:hypothetical protein